MLGGRRVAADPDLLEWQAAHDGVDHSTDPDLLEWQQAQSNISIGPRSWLDTGKDLARSLGAGTVELGTSIADLNPFNPNAGNTYGSLFGRLSDYIRGIEHQPSFQDISASNSSTSQFVPQIEQSARLNVDTSKMSTPERYANAAAKFAPTALLGGGLPAALAAGAGGEIAKDAGLPEWLGQIIGGVSPSLVKAPISAVTQPFREAGQKALVGKTLLAEAGTTGKQNLLAEALRNEPAMGEFGPLTYGEVAKTPSAAALQYQARKLPGEGSNIFESAISNRDAARIEALKGISPTSLAEGLYPMQERGQLARALGEPIVDAKMIAAQKPFEDLPRETLIPVIDQKIAAKDILENALADRTIGLPKDAEKVISSFIKGPDAITLNKAQKLLQELPEVAAKNDMRGELVKAVSSITDKVRSAVQNAAEGGNTGAADFLKLSENYKNLAQTYKGAIGQTISGKGAYGSYNTLEENILRPVIQSPTRAQEFMKAFGKHPDMVEQAKGALIDDMTKLKDRGRWVKYFEEKQPQFKAVLGEDYSKFKQVINDIKSETSVGELATKASRGQSITSQALTVAGKILRDGPRLITKALSSSSGPIFATGAGGIIGGFKGAALGVAASKVAAWAEKNMDKLLAQAMVDPAIRMELVKAANESTATKVLLSLVSKVAPPALLFSTKDLRSVENSKLGKLLISPNQDLSLEQNTSKPTATQQINKTALSGLLNSSETPQILSAKRVSMDAKLKPIVEAVIRQESAGNPKAISKVGAQGLMQLMPETGKELFKKAGLSGEYDPYNAEQNKKLGTMYLKELIDRYDGDIKLALAAYNYGLGRIDKLLRQNNAKTFEDIHRFLPTETQRYVPGVLSKIKNSGAIEI